MNSFLPNRRAFLQQSAVLAATVFLPGALRRSQAAPAAKCQPLRLGGPSYAKTSDPEELALAHRKLGYRAAYCPGVSLQDSDKIRAFAEAFAKHFKNDYLAKKK
jgi:hypothetical protein